MPPEQFHSRAHPGEKARWNDGLPVSLEVEGPEGQEIQGAVLSISIPEDLGLLRRQCRPRAQHVEWRGGVMPLTLLRPICRAP